MLTVLTLAPVADGGPLDGAIRFAARADGRELAGGHRGRGYVDQLLRIASRAARARGWAGMLSDVDVQNRPMLAAMARTGASAGARPWHRWMYRRVAT